MSIFCQEKSVVGKFQLCYIFCMTVEGMRETGEIIAQDQEVDGQHLESEGLVLTLNQPEIIRGTGLLPDSFDNSVFFLKPEAGALPVVSQRSGS